MSDAFSGIGETFKNVVSCLIMSVMFIIVLLGFIGYLVMR